MQKVEGIGGIFFRAQDPEALADWYEEHLGIDQTPGNWLAAAGPNVVIPFPDDTEYFGRDEQQWMISFRVADLEAMIEQLEDAGIEVITNTEWDSEFGSFARIHDPEGNPIELWQPAPAAAG